MEKTALEPGMRFVETYDNSVFTIIKVCKKTIKVHNETHNIEISYRLDKFNERVLSGEIKEIIDIKARA